MKKVGRPIKSVDHKKSVHNAYHRKYYEKRKQEIKQQKLDRLALHGFDNFYQQNMSFANPQTTEQISELIDHTKQEREEVKHAVKRPIPGFSKYQVTDKGIVVVFNEILQQWTEAKVTQSYTGNLLVDMVNDNNKKVVKVVAKLVCEIWKNTPCPADKKIYHKDGDLLNCDPSNLTYRKK